MLFMQWAVSAVCGLHGLDLLFEIRMLVVHRRFLVIDCSSILNVFSRLIGYFELASEPP
jgi:hypothetical protein